MNNNTVKWYLSAAALLLLSACSSGNNSAIYSARSPQMLTVSGTVSGLSGTGLVLQNSSSDSLAVNANGSFTFNAAVVSGNTYSVTVTTQPVSPGQVCTVSSGTGTVSDAPVTNVQVACIVMGDINGDGIVDHRDGLLAQRIALGMDTASSDQLARGDIHANGKIDISDFLLIQKLVLTL